MFLLVADFAHPNTVQAMANLQHSSAHSSDVSHRDAGHHDTVIDIREQHNSEVGLVFVLQYCSYATFLIYCVKTPVL